MNVYEARELTKAAILKNDISEPIFEKIRLAAKAGKSEIRVFDFDVDSIINLMDAGFVVSDATSGVLKVNW